MSYNAHRSARADYWEQMWALEAELERDGFRRFHDIGHLYDREAATTDSFTQRPTTPSLVTSKPRACLGWHP